MRPAQVTLRAVEAAAAVAREHGLRCDDARVIDDRLNVIVHLAPAPVVARVSTTASSAGRDRDWLERELAVAGFLAERGAPVVGPSGELPPGPHVHDGLWLTFWELAEHERGREPPLEQAARMLCDLHAALSGYGDELPLLEPVLGEVPRMIDDLAASGGLTEADAAMLRRVHERIAPALRGLDLPLQAVHGDAHVGNLLATPRGFLWVDFEETCAAPVEWDLACLTFASSALAEETLAAYPGPIHHDRLDLMTEARALQIAAWSSLVAMHDPSHRDRAEARLRRLRERHV